MAVSQITERNRETGENWFGRFCCWIDSHLGFWSGMVLFEA